VAAVDGSHGCGDAGGGYEAVAVQTFYEGCVCGAVGAPGHCCEGVGTGKCDLSEWKCWWRFLDRMEVATTLHGRNGVIELVACDFLRGTSNSACLTLK